MIAAIFSIAKIWGLRALTGAWTLWLSPGGRVLIRAGLIVVAALIAWWWWADTRGDLIEQGRREARGEIEREARDNVEKADRVRRADRGAGARGVRLDPHIRD